MGSSETENQDEQIGAALLWALGGAFMVSILLSLPKLGGEGIHPFQITFFRYVTAVVILMVFWLVRRAYRPATYERLEDNETRKSWTWLHILRALLAAVRITCIFSAISIIPLANVQAILLTNGVFVTLFVGLLLREHVPAIAVVLGLACLGGGLLAADPDFSGGASWQLGGAVLAFLGAILFGLEAVIIKFSAARDSNFRILFAVNLAALVFSSIPAAMVWTPFTWSPMFFLLGMGPVALIVQTCNLEAFRRARASMIVPIRYTGVIFATLMGFLVFGEIPTVMVFVGMVVIAISGTALAWLTSPNRKTPVIRPVV